VVSSPDLIRNILVEQDDKFEKTDHTKDSTSTFLGEGLLVSAGQTHKRHRCIIQPLFTSSNVAQYASVMVDAACALLDTWQHGETRDVAHEMMLLTLNIVGQTIFGFSTTAQSEAIRQASAIIQRYTDETMRRSKLTSVTQDERQQAVAVLDQVIAGVLTQNGTSQHDLISLMRSAIDPETGGRMSDHEVRDEALTMLMAGHETTANALAWTLYLLAKHPAVEARLVQEIAEVVGENPVSATHVPQLPYLEKVSKEALRVYPPVWLMGRTPVEPVMVGDFTISPSANIILSPYVIHRNPRYFPDAEVFDPDRFDTEPVRYSYLPFGAGPHVCIGQSFAMLELALVVTTIIQRFRLHVDDAFVAEPDPMMTLRPKGGLPMTLIAREGLS
jgi:cytochrome P450